MRTLIVPMAGKSSRFPNVRPKWMMTHPNGRFMGIESILGLNLEFFDKILFVMLREHETQYGFCQGFARQLEELELLEKSSTVYLDKPTSSQSETVAKAIQQANVQDFIFVKDADNYFSATIAEGNQVCFFDLNDMDNINARSKSYIQMDTNGRVENIVEKQVVSSTFSVGGYGFASAESFMKSYGNTTLRGDTAECYVSNVIFQMMLEGQVFIGTKTAEFEDWGTLEAWNKYKSQYKTLFVDIDGTLITNSSRDLPPFTGQGEPVKENIEWLQQMHKTGKVQIILTTSRTRDQEAETWAEIEKHQIPNNGMIIMDLYHAQRVVVNDFAPSNPYPSCQAINLPRNANNLKDYIQ